MLQDLDMYAYIILTKMNTIPNFDTFLPSSLKAGPGAGDDAGTTLVIDNLFLLWLLSPGCSVRNIERPL